ncbi:hypothetical protein GUITHDRAFT_99280 [Guillardia theta CCMP2712]|uniref:Uncharacterized protein n=1 Tax=Guillardia theta (strain CCMP2712) TaxID=905079 RepID=L1K4W7_GUITC|nr:hypothetical protein GUITHDRAFT_99280 [Guillardia theta CCMP2712]EKX55505.1 hypothetical protein GUITHDRAFT_99280 [Guillardia theta CCMP2712]|eukprot:XP_005842485.1 hypothetical protein GUITHDRAFT_99280 [Guillardia theta CCMP2712]
MLASAHSMLVGHAAEVRNRPVRPRTCLCQVNFDWIETSVKKGLAEITQRLSNPQGSHADAGGEEQEPASDAVERSIMVRATAEECFQVATAFEDYPKWARATSSVREGGEPHSEQPWKKSRDDHGNVREDSEQYF